MTADEADRADRQGAMRDSELLVYSTCPSSKQVPIADYGRRVAEVARWTEDNGLEGLLVYTENAFADPWLVAQHIIAATTRTRPLVAVQPAYMHPFTLARMVGSLAHLYRRDVHINFVVGGAGPDLAALGESLDHDSRYDRLVEYHEAVRRLLTTDGPISFAGTYYRLSGARLNPGLDPALRPRMFVSGSSATCARVAGELDMVRLSYPEEPAAYGDDDGRSLDGCGIRLGIIARDSGAAAWRVAEHRFPTDRDGEAGGGGAPAQRPGYWLHPFRRYKTYCPYLVGSYAEVGQTLARYLDLGVRTIILDVPREEEDLAHAREALRLALGGAVAADRGHVQPGTVRTCASAVSGSPR